MSVWSAASPSWTYRSAPRRSSLRGGKEWRGSSANSNTSISNYDSASRMTNLRADAWLRSSGFDCEEEPPWVTGQKPDFFCTGAFDFWAEVKTLRHEDRFERLAAAHQQLRQRLSRIKANAKAMAWVRPPLDARDGKVLATLVAREVRRVDFGVDQGKHFVLIPEQPMYGKFVRFGFQTEDGERAAVLAVLSKTGTYGWPAILTPKSYSQEIVIEFSDGKTRKCRLREITTFTDNLRAAMEISVCDQEFSLVGTSPVGAAAKVTTVHRIRNAVSEANQQTKN